MQIYQAEVCIGGLLTNTVVKSGLTAAEIMLLQHEHGADAVRAIKPGKNVKRPYQDEYNRLLKAYGRKKFEKVFPGGRPVLPEKLADVGIMVKEDGHTTTETIASGPNNKGRKTQQQKNLESQGIEGDDDDEDLDLGMDDDEE